MIHKRLWRCGLLDSIPMTTIQRELDVLPISSLSCWSAACLCVCVCKYLCLYVCVWSPIFCIFPWLSAEWEWESDMIQAGF